MVDGKWDESEWKRMDTSVCVFFDFKYIQSNMWIKLEITFDVDEVHFLSILTLHAENLASRDHLKISENRIKSRMKIT